MVGQNQAKDRESRQGKGIVGNGVIYYSAVPETKKRRDSSTAVYRDITGIAYKTFSTV